MGQGLLVRSPALHPLHLPQEDSEGQSGGSGDNKELPGVGEGSQNNKGCPSYVDLVGVTGASGSDPGDPGPDNFQRLSLRDSKVGLSGTAARRPKRTISGRYRLLAPWKDEAGIWRVGGRSRDTVPFTSDGKPAILLPEHSRYTYLAMKAAHDFAHSGVEATVVQFRSDGWWSVRAGKLAKGIKNKCVRCRYLDLSQLTQRMGKGG